MSCKVLVAEPNVKLIIDDSKGSPKEFMRLMEDVANQIAYIYNNCNEDHETYEEWIERNKEDGINVYINLKVVFL